MFGNFSTSTVIGNMNSKKSTVIIFDVRVSAIRANSLSTSEITSDDRICMDKVSMILEKTGLTTKYFQKNSSQIFKKRPVGQ